MLYILLSIQVILFIGQCGIVDRAILNTQYCSNSQKQSLSWAFNSEPQQTHIRASNYYEEATGDSAALRLVRNSTTTNFQVIFYDKNFQSYVYADALNSANNASHSFELNGMIRNYLVLKRTAVTNGGIDYLAYRFDPITMTSTAGYVISVNPVPPYTAFVPYSSFEDVSSRRLAIGIIKTIGTSVTQYILTVTWTTSGVASAKIFKIVLNPLINLDDFRGNQNVLVHRDTAGKQILIYQQAQVNGTFTPSTGSPIPFNINSNQNLILKTYSLRKGAAIVSMIDETGTKGWLLPIKQSYTFSLWRVDLASSTSVLKEYSDDVQNFMSIGSDQIFWYNFVYNDLNSSIRIPTSQISTTDLQGVALSGNVATFLYSNQIDYYRISPSGTFVSKIFSNSFSSNDMTLTGNNRWRVAVSCMCSKMVIGCFGESFLCVIRRAALSSCF